jgi:hypothetical protein
MNQDFAEINRNSIEVRQGYQLVTVSLSDKQKLRFDDFIKLLHDVRARLKDGSALACVDFIMSEEDERLTIQLIGYRMERPEETAARVAKREAEEAKEQLRREVAARYARRNARLQFLAQDLSDEQLENASAIKLEAPCT